MRASKLSARCFPKRPVAWQIGREAATTITKIIHTATIKSGGFDYGRGQEVAPAPKPLLETPPSLLGGMKAKKELLENA